MCKCTKPTFSLLEFSQEVLALSSASQSSWQSILVSCNPFLSRGVIDQKGPRAASLELRASNTGVDKTLPTSDTYVRCQTTWSLEHTAPSRLGNYSLQISTNHDISPSTLSVLGYPHPTSSKSSEKTSEKLGSVVSSPLGSQHPLFDLHTRLAGISRTLAGNAHELFCIKVATRAFELADEDHLYDHVRPSILQHVTIRSHPDWHWSMKQREKGAESTVTSLHLTLTRSEYERIKHDGMAKSVSHGKHRAYIALGSNVGDRVDSIQTACQQMIDRGIHVTRTSALYETKPMYLEDQQHFVNGVCEVCCSSLQSSLQLTTLES